MAPHGNATIEDLYCVPGKAELVNGFIVRDSPTGGLPGFAAGELYASLRVYARATGLGHAIPDNVGFVVDLPNRRSFSPDAAFCEGRLTMQFIEGAPPFAVEVRSEGDYGPAAERRMTAKRDDYFAAGTLVVWDVDLQNGGVIKVFRCSAPGSPSIYRRGQSADAEPALPGWTFPVADLFPPE